MSMTNRAPYKPLREAAVVFMRKAHQHLDESPTGRDVPWQSLIDALPDHNQTMIDAIEESSPTLDAIIEELMAAEPSESAQAWTSLVNFIFDEAHKIHDSKEEG